MLLKEAVRFHGHLGPYLVLGLLAGALALRRLKARKYFGLDVQVFGANKRPKSCLVDGLQLSTGATYGKGNIKKYSAKDIKVIIRDCKKNKHAVLTIKKEIKKALASLKNHSDSEKFAGELLRKPLQKIFSIK